MSLRVFVKKQGVRRVLASGMYRFRKAMEAAGQRLPLTSIVSVCAYMCVCVHMYVQHRVRNVSTCLRASVCLEESPSQ